MGVIPTITIEADFVDYALLDADDKALLDADDKALLAADIGWEDISADVLTTAPIRIKTGNTGLSQTDRVGDIGTMHFSLNNSDVNSGGQLGYYSPSNTNVRPHFDEETKLRLTMSYGADSKIKFQGIRLDVIDPDSGIYGPRTTRVTAVDWFDEAANAPASSLDLALAKRDDQLIDLLLDTMLIRPESTNFTTGPQQYAAAFHNVESGETKIISLLEDIALSGVGTIFLNDGEVLTYRSRHDILMASTPVAVLDNSMVDIKAPRIAKNRVKRVLGTTHPVRVDTAATTVVFQLNSSIAILPGQSIEFTAKYTDPDQESSSIAATDFQTITSDDYEFASRDGFAGDLNGDLAISMENFVDSTVFTFTNNAAVIGYLWELKLYAKGVYLYDSIQHTATDDTIIKGQDLSYDMPFQSEFAAGQSITDALLTWETDAENERPVVHFKANRNAALMAAAINVQPGDLVTLTETVTGIDRNYFVLGIEYDIKAQGRDIDVYWHCMPVQDAQAFCVLNQVGYAELNTNAILAW